MYRKSVLEMAVEMRIKSAGLPVPEREYKFWPGRRFAFDFAFVPQMVAVECEGGIWIQGRHSRGVGMLADMKKYNTATIMGWRVLRYSTNNIDDLIPDLKKILPSTLKSGEFCIKNS